MKKSKYNLIATGLEYDDALKKAKELTRNNAEIKFTDKPVEKPHYNILIRSK